MQPHVAVSGYRELLHALNQADRESKLYGRKVLADSGDAVRSDAAAFFARIDERTAAGFRSRARVKGVQVYQSKRKVTGKHPEYGAFQMKVLRKAVLLRLDDVERGLERALALMALHFNRGGPA